MLCAAPGDHRLAASFAQLLTMPVGFAASIGVDDLGLLERSATRTADRRNRVDQRQQLRDVVAVRASQDGADGNAIGVYKDVVLETRSRAIRGVRACFSPTPTARTDEASTATYEKSIWPASRSLSCSNSCIRRHTPAV